MNKAARFFVISVFCLSLSYGDDTDRINKLAEECRAGKAKSCGKLLKMATEDKDPKVREAAVGKLDDQAALLNIVKKEGNVDVRLAAVKKLEDQSILAQLVKTDKWATIQNAALQRITDQSLLFDIAKTVIYPSIAEAAIERLTDQAVLAELINNTDDQGIIRKAMGRMTDQTALAAIAGQAVQGTARLLAVERISDQAGLADIAKTAVDPMIYKAAVNRISDQAALTDVARMAANWGVRRAAVNKLTDPAALREIIAKDEQWEVRQAALKVMTEPSHLVEIAKTDHDARVRWEAVKKLTDPVILAQTARKDESWLVRATALANLTDKTAQVNSALKDPDPNVRTTALWKLDDPKTVAAIAQNDKNPYVREAAVLKLKLAEETGGLVPVKTPDAASLVSGIEAIQKVEVRLDKTQFEVTADDEQSRLIAFVFKPFFTKEKTGFLDRNRLVLIDQDGRQYQYMAVAPGSRNDSAWIARGGPLPLEKHDVTFAFDGASFTTDFAPAQGEAKISWTGADPEFRILFKISGDRPILSVRFDPYPPRPIPSAEDASGDYHILDQNFVDTSLPFTSGTDVVITSVEKGGFGFKGNCEIRNNKYLFFARGAKHTWEGTLSAFGYVILSYPKQPLRFKVTETGYQYLGGSGTIRFPDGRTVILSEEK